MKFPASPTNLTSDDERVIREHWQWAGRYAMLWTIGTILIFGTILALLEFAGADAILRTESLLILTAVTVVNVVWRAAGALAARFEFILRKRHGLDS